jgi:hypothetical protein
MNYNEQTRKILGKQKFSSEDNENIFKPLVKDSDSIFRLVTSAYYLGLINGKRSERSKQKQQVLEV